MQNWEAMQPTANYVEHNTWYNNMFATNIKTESTDPSPTNQSQQQQHVQQTTLGINNKAPTTRLETYLKQQQFSSIESLTAMTPSPNNNINNNNNNNEAFFEIGSNHTQLLQQKQYQQHFQQAAQQAAGQNQITSHLQLGFNPLTPPGLPNAIINGISHFYPQNASNSNQQSPAAINANSLNNVVDQSDKAILTPRLTPPMDITPPKSPKTTTTSSSLMDIQMSDKEDQEVLSNSSEDNKILGGESEYDEYIRMPIYNSHGKMKTHKCKSCGLVAITKIAFWEHTRTHENPEKILQCPKCPFWAKVKHHLEFHICKHKNLKPFECDKCEYSCENKSMLASHRKKHSSVYQYRCADCDYATKFCHAFKQHLRKYEHKPGIVLDEEGIPNPTVIIDVYGTRRGPKNKSSTANCGKRMANGELKTAVTSQLSAALQGFTVNHNQVSTSPDKGANDLSTTAYCNSINPTKTNTVVTDDDDSPSTSQNSTINNSSSTLNQASSNLPTLLPPLDSLIQQNHNMTFLSYWNLNLQMLAAQQQVAVLAQLSPPVKEQQTSEEDGYNEGNISIVNNAEDDVNEENDSDCEDVKPQLDDKLELSSAIDLSQSTPNKDDKDAVKVAVNLKMNEENTATPLYTSTGASKRKGRVLKLDSEQQPTARNPADSSELNPPSPPSATNSSKLSKYSTTTNGPPDTELSNITSTIPIAASVNNNNNLINSRPSSTSTSSTASSSSSSSSSSTSSCCSSSSATSSSATTSSTTTTTISTATSTASNLATPSTTSSPPSTVSTTNTSTTIKLSDLFECKYCDIYFKDAVLYTIHMGYHSCDDVFKCNMCGEKCDGPIGLFVHMARNAHS